MTTKIERLPLRRQQVLLRDEETRSLLVDPDRGVTHVLNPTARAIWELCDGATTLEEVVNAICQVFSVPPGPASRDVAEVLMQFEEAGLVTWSSPGPGEG